MTPPDTQLQPLATIITVVYNGVNQIEETITSILSHKNTNLEYVIIDGGSTDGTVDIIKKYSSHLSYWISEPDKGIYYALNKGMKAARGYYVLAINLGDKLTTFPQDELLQAKNAGIDIALFDVQFSDGRIFKSRITFQLTFANTVHHQGAFYKNSPLLQYQTRYKVFADFDLNQKLLLQKKTFKKFNKIISYHDLEGVSNDKKYRREYYSVIKANFGKIHQIMGALYINQGEFRMGLKKILKKARQ